MNLKIEDNCINTQKAVNSTVKLNNTHMDKFAKTKEDSNKQGKNSVV